MKTNLVLILVFFVCIHLEARGQKNININSSPLTLSKGGYELNGFNSLIYYDRYDSEGTTEDLGGRVSILRSTFQGFYGINDRFDIGAELLFSSGSFDTDESASPLNVFNFSRKVSTQQVSNASLESLGLRFRYSLLDGGSESDPYGLSAQLGVRVPVSNQESLSRDLLFLDQVVLDASLFYYDGLFKSTKMKFLGQIGMIYALPRQDNIDLNTLIFGVDSGERKSSFFTIPIGVNLSYFIPVINKTRANGKSNDFYLAPFVSTNFQVGFFENQFASGATTRSNTSSLQWGFGVQGQFERGLGMNLFYQQVALAKNNNFWSSWNFSVIYRRDKVNKKKSR